MSRLCQRSALVFGLFLSLAAARGQYSFSDQNTTRSFSGQFVASSVDESPFPRPNLNPTANTNVVQLKTALLAVSAERFKESLWQQLGITANTPWSGKIFLQIHPARSLDETETITSSPFLNYWQYHVQLPDMLWKTRYARVLSGVLLLEIANRTASADGRSSDVPAWLVDGLAQQVLVLDGDKFLLSAPHAKGNAVPVIRLSRDQRGYDPLADVRQILQNSPALTFDQLSWPTGEQMNGADGGVYYASAQLFVSELLGMKNGKQKMCAMLAALPDHLNWQMAFFKAFAEDFTRPLDVEKWWTLHVVNFVSRTGGTQWTTDSSISRLQDLVTVPVEYRTGSNSLPMHADISLQSALQNLSADQRDLVIHNKVRDLGLMELRMAPPFGGLADSYRVILADFLGESRESSRPPTNGRHGSPVAGKPAGLTDTLKKLDALDLQRRMAEARATIAFQVRSQAENQ